MLTALQVLVLLSWGCGFWVLFALRRCPSQGPAIDARLLSVVIPARDEEARLPALLESLRRQDRSPLEVIVVDDHSRDRTAEIAERLGWPLGTVKTRTRRALRRLLSAAGFRVATFASAEEFMASESAGATSCLVLDVHLGGMSGFDLQQRLATAGAQIPTIFITAHDDPVTRERARSGAAYLRKPFREDALIGAIREALQSRGA